MPVNEYGFELDQWMTVFLTAVGGGALTIKDADLDGVLAKIPSSWRWSRRGLCK